MGEFVTFVLRRWAIALIAVSAVFLTGLGYVQQGIALWQNGPPGWSLQLAGFLLFLGVVTYLIFDFDKKVRAVPNPAEAEAVRERSARRRKIIDEARMMVAKHELQTRWTWDQTMRYSPEFAAVRPHLSPSFFREGGPIRIFIHTKQIHEYHVEEFVRELDRLEREWRLS
jgi:hypothetical protein